MGKRPKTDIEKLAERLAEVLNDIPRPIEPSQIDLRMLAELAWAFGLAIHPDFRLIDLDETSGGDRHGE